MSLKLWSAPPHSIAVGMQIRGWFPYHTNNQLEAAKQPISVPDLQKTLGPHYQLELFLQLGGLYTNATITLCRNDRFWSRFKQTSEVIFTPETVSNKRDSPIAHLPSIRGKKKFQAQLCWQGLQQTMRITSKLKTLLLT